MPLYIQLQQNHHNASAPSLANALNDVINSLFKQYDRIGYELIQNADDAATDDQLNREIEFFILNDYLIIQHNGKHFTENDVQALCRY